MGEKIRERTEKNEHLLLSPLASFSDAAKRETDETECDIRTAYQRDRDRIIHCNAFRRLKHKTQVFVSPEGDHYRTRLTHTLEVAQIARTVSRALRLNEDLTEAIALGHDLGHTPFGHAGERALDKLYSGGFKHYAQSVRVCKIVEKRGRGLNLTKDTLNGIYCHTKGENAYTLEGRIVRFCDQIAYVNHDIDDAVRAGVITNSDIPHSIRAHFGEKKSERINAMTFSLINNSTDDIVMAQKDKEKFDELHAFLFERVYNNALAKSEEDKVNSIIEGLYSYLLKHPEKLSTEFNHILETEGVERASVDYIAGMTDTYAIRFFENIYVPKSWDI